MCPSDAGITWPKVAFTRPGMGSGVWLKALSVGRMWLAFASIPATSTSCPRP